MVFADSARPSALPAAGLPVEKPAAPVRHEVVDGRGLLFWYHGLGAERASASCRYRIGNLVERMRGATVVVDHAKLPRGALDGVHTVVCARPFVERPIAKILRGLRQRGVRLVADFDDLLFDCPLEEYPLFVQEPESRERHAHRLRVYRESLAYFDAFTVSTEPLAARLRAVCPDRPVTVVPNGVSERWLEAGRLLHRPWRPGDPKIIRYLPGSPTHDADFEIARPALERFLARHADVRLEIVGPLRFERSGFPAGRVSHFPWVPYDELPRYIANTWVNLAPLMPTGFNACKSAVKYLEAGAFGAPTVASTVGEVPLGCLAARTTDEWLRNLGSLFDDETRERFGRSARTFVLARRTAAHSVGAFVAARGAWKELA